MTDYIVKDTSLVAVANKIRTKTGGSSLISFPGGFESAIESMVDTSDATATEDKILAGYSAYGSAGTKLDGTIPIKTSSDLQVSANTVNVPSGYYASSVSKSVASGAVTITTTSITANPSISISNTGLISAGVITSGTVVPNVNSGYVSSVASGTVTVTGSSSIRLSTQDAGIYTPTNAEQTIVSAGKYTTGDQKIEAVICSNLTAGNIKKDVVVKIGTATDDDSVALVTGTYDAGGGGYTKPSYLISDGDTFSTMYFNTEYNLGAFLAGLTYDMTEQTYGYNYAYLSLSYLIAIDLSTIPNAGLTGYVLCWADPNAFAIFYSTSTFDLSSVLPELVVATVGWQVSFFAPSTAQTYNESTSNAAFNSTMDEFVAQDDTAFGSHGGGTQPQLNAPTISINQNTLTITDSANNGNFTTDFKVYADGTQVGTVSKSTTTTYDLSSLSGNNATITVKAAGTYFEDSAASTSASWTRYVQVSFYDGASQLTHSPVTVATGTTIAQAISTGGISTVKTGYDFVAWYSNAQLIGNPIDINTIITAEITLYGKWEKSVYITENSTIISTPYSYLYVGLGAFSPDGKYFVSFDNSKNIQIYNTESDPWAKVQTISSVASYAGGSIIFINNTRFVAATKNGLKCYAISGTSVTNETTTYIPYTLRNLQHAYSNNDTLSKVNSNGKFAFKSIANSTIYVIDTSTTPYSILATITGQSSIGISQGSVGLLEDDSIIYFYSNTVYYVSSADYSASPSAVFYRRPSVSIQRQEFYQYGNIISVSASNENITNNLGFYVYSYSNGTFTQSKFIKDTDTNHFYILNPADNHYIKNNSTSSKNTIEVYDWGNTLIQTMESFGNYNSKSGIELISPNGTKAAGRLSQSPYLVTYTIKPAQ